MTFTIRPDPALVGPRESYEKHTRELELQGQLEKSPTPRRVSELPINLSGGRSSQVLRRESIRSTGRRFHHELDANDHYERPIPT